jgi:hypothetical protein
MTVARAAIEGDRICAKLWDRGGARSGSATLVRGGRFQFIDIIGQGPGAGQATGRRRRGNRMTARPDLVRAAFME